MNFNFKNFTFLSIFVLLSLTTLANEKKVEIKHADKFRMTTIDGVQYRKLIGNVVLFHDGVTMYCDSAYQYPDRNLFDAYGNVRINQGDSLHLSGKFLNYNGNDGMAKIRENVELKEKSMQLYTDELFYDLNNSMAYYLDFGTVKDEDNVLTSKKGYYYSESKNVFFKDSVILVNPNYIMESDTLIYNTETHIASFFGPTTITSDDNIIYCERGWYNTDNNRSQFSKNAWILSGDQKLYGDSLFYYREDDFAFAKGNIKATDTIVSYYIFGQYAEHYNKRKYTFVTENTWAEYFMENDTLYISADTLVTFFDTTMTYRMLSAYNNVKSYSHQMQMVCDSAIYNEADSTITLFYDPVFWNETSQITADKIKIFTYDNEIKEVEMTNNSLIISAEDSLHFNQVKGRKMNGRFKENELYFIYVQGNSQSIYFLKDDDEAYIGVNKIESSDIRIFLANKLVDRITFERDPIATVYPMGFLSPAELKLDGFKWLEDIRPFSAEEVMKK